MPEGVGSNPNRTADTKRMQVARVAPLACGVAEMDCAPSVKINSLQPFGGNQAPVASQRLARQSQ